MLGEVVSDYRLEDELWRDGWGVVYRAVHTKVPGIEVAVRVVEHAPDTEGDPAEALLRGCAVLDRLDHPGIARFRHLEPSETWTALVMDRLEGKSLLQILADAPLPPRLVVEILEPVLEALAYAHRQELVHGELGPASVFVGSNGRVRLLDFGVAAALANAVAPHEPDTAAAFMAPERFDGASPPASDVYAVGQLAWWLAAGHAACEATTRDEAARWHRERGAPDLDAVRPATPAWLTRWVRALTARDLTQRLAHGDAALALLRRIQAEQPEIWPKSGMRLLPELVKGEVGVGFDSPAAPRVARPPVEPEVPSEAPVEPPAEPPLLTATAPAEDPAPPEGEPELDPLQKGLLVVAAVLAACLAIGALVMAFPTPGEAPSGPPAQAQDPAPAAQDAALLPPDRGPAVPAEPARVSGPTPAGDPGKTADEPPPSSDPEVVHAGELLGAHTGSLTVVTVPPGARVVVDGVEVGTAPVTVRELPGLAEVQLSLDGYRSVQRSLSIEAGQRAELGPVELERLPALFGVVEIFGVGLEGGGVSVDGGARVPLPAQVELPAGVHEFQVFAPDGETYTVTRSIAFDGSGAAVPVDLQAL